MSRLIESVAPASLETVLLTDALMGRPLRATDAAAEARALVSLAEALAEAPRTTHHRLADLVRDLCGADSAGVSLRAEEGDGSCRCLAGVGRLAPEVCGAMGRVVGPWTMTIEQDKPLLFACPERHFFPTIPVDPPLVEALQLSESHSFIANKLHAVGPHR